MNDGFAPTQYRAEVKHHHLHLSGVVCYWNTFKDAAEWVASWPDAIDARITRETMRGIPEDKP